MFNDILSISFIVISIGVWIVTIYRLKESKYQLFNVIEKVFKGIEVVYKRHKIAVLATTASLFLYYQFCVLRMEYQLLKNCSIIN